MSIQAFDDVENVLRLARNGSGSANGADPLDAAGQTILGLLHRAAGMAEANQKRALDVAQKLSAQLHAAENRIRQLETDLRHQQDRADRAEQWLYQISSEIEQRFFSADDGRRTRPPSPLALLRASGRKSAG